MSRAARPRRARTVGSACAAPPPCAPPGTGSTCAARTGYAAAPAAGGRGGGGDNPWCGGWAPRRGVARHSGAAGQRIVLPPRLPGRLALQLQPRGSAQHPPSRPPYGSTHLLIQKVLLIRQQVAQRILRRRRAAVGGRHRCCRRRWPCSRWARPLLAQWLLLGGSPVLVLRPASRAQVGSEWQRAVAAVAVAASAAAAAAAPQARPGACSAAWQCRLAQEPAARLPQGLQPPAAGGWRPGGLASRPPNTHDIAPRLCKAGPLRRPCCCGRSGVCSRARLGAVSNAPDGTGKRG